MNRTVSVESLHEGDRFEFITTRSEWADNCFLPHPQGILVVAKSAFLDPYQQCRFAYRLEKFPNGRPQEWWGVSDVEVRLVGRPAKAAVENLKKPAKKKQAGRN